MLQSHLQSDATFVILSAAGRPYRAAQSKELLSLVMPVAALTLELRIPLSRSLKDRRQVVRSLKDKLRHSFNVSVAELDEAVTWQSATIGIAAISSSRDYLAGLIAEAEKAATRIATDLGAEVTDSWWEYLEPS